MTYSPHAHVQRVYGGKRRQSYWWACPWPDCTVTRYASFVPVCPVHSARMRRSLS